MIEVVDVNGAVEFRVRVVPRASRTEVAGEMDGAVKVRVSSPPVDGAANAELISFFAKTFGVSKSSVRIVSGQSSKQKRLRIEGITAERVQAAISG